jgi:hypothetical protein
MPYHRPGIIRQSAGRNHEGQWRLNPPIGRGVEKAMRSWAIAGPRKSNSRCAAGSRRFMIANGQNVAGMWLKYGVSA